MLPPTAAPPVPPASWPLVISVQPGGVAGTPPPAPTPTARTSTSPLLAPAGTAIPVEVTLVEPLPSAVVGEPCTLTTAPLPTTAAGVVTASAADRADSSPAVSTAVTV